MVGILIRMNLAMQHNSRSGMIRFWASVGLLLAVGTLVLSLIYKANPALSADLLASVFAAWTLLLALAPVFGRGGDGIRPENLALLPIPPRRLAIGLVGAEIVGIAPAIALVAFAALAVYGFQIGPVAGLVGVLAALLQLLLGVLLARLVYAVMGEAMQTRLGMELAAFQFALFLAVVSVGWFVIQPVAGQLDQILSRGWPPMISTIFRILPSGWGLIAVDAAGRHDWPAALAVLLGLSALIAGLFLLWAAFLRRSTASKPASISAGSRPATRQATFPFRPPATPIGAVIAKELHAWTRDPWRAFNLRIAFWTGLLIGVVPLLVGWVDILPFVGIIITVMGGGVSGNLYAVDGSALWQILLTPGAERIDVRGRQWAWLLIFGPVSLAATVLFTLLSGRAWAWPLVLALLLAVLGGTAGLVPLFSVRFLSPGIEPNLRRNPMDSSGSTLNEIILMPWLALATAIPALVIVGLGFLQDNLAIQWLGLPVGAGTGVLFAWWLGRVAYRQLEASGPEILNLLLKGSAAQAKMGEESLSKRAWRELPIWKKAIVWFCGGLFWIPLSLQGILPVVIKLSGSEGGPALDRSWFLAFHLPAEFYWPVIIAMMALGLLMIFLAVEIPRKNLQELQRREKSA